MPNQSNIMIKRNLQLPDRRTSIQLEDYVWQSIDAILSLETISLSMLCAELDRNRREMKLASSMRLFALIYFRTVTDYFTANQSHQFDSNSPYSSMTKHVNCFLIALQQFVQYAQNADKPSEKTSQSQIHQPSH